MKRFYGLTKRRLSAKWAHDAYHVATLGLLLALTLPASSSGALGLVAIWALGRELNRYLLHVGY